MFSGRYRSTRHGAVRNVFASRRGRLLGGGHRGALHSTRHLPATFPAPIVIAQHLEPTRPSHLAEILARRTTLAVRSLADNGVQLAPGVIFVVPANRDVRITDSEIAPQVREDGTRTPLPSVDLLLSPAAEVYGDRLIAVILSGTGSDGAAGARVVKKAGGRSSFRIRRRRPIQACRSRSRRTPWISSQRRSDRRDPERPASRDARPDAARRAATTWSHFSTRFARATTLTSIATRRRRFCAGCNAASLGPIRDARGLPASTWRPTLMSGSSWSPPFLSRSPTSFATPISSNICGLVIPDLIDYARRPRRGAACSGPRAAPPERRPTRWPSSSLRRWGANSNNSTSASSAPM